MTKERKILLKYLLKQYKQSLRQTAIYKSSLGGFKKNDKVSVIPKQLRKFEEEYSVKGGFHTKLQNAMRGTNNSFIITELWVNDDQDGIYAEKAQIMIHGFEDLNRQRWYVPIVCLKKR